jgi:pyruvate dehydrogenase E2 component (dihydrolipoamide acetyltransferase)
MTDITLPKVSMNMTDGVVLEWHVDEGDTVASGDPLVTVETDKATSDVVADQDGTLLRRAVDERETVPVGTVLGYVGEDESDLPDGDADGNEEADDDTGSSTGYGDASIGASPTARRIARERGVDLAAVRNALDVDQIRPPHIAEYVEDHAEDDADHLDFLEGQEQIIDRFSIVGTAEDHIEKLKKLGERGVDQFNIYLMTEGQEATLAAYGQDIVPQFAGARTQ